MRKRLIGWAAVMVAYGGGIAMQASIAGHDTKHYIYAGIGGAACVAAAQMVDAVIKGYESRGEPK